MAYARAKQTIITERLIREVLEYRKTHTREETSKYFKIALGTVTNIQKGNVKSLESKITNGEEKVHRTREIDSDFSKDCANITIRSLDVKTLEDALRVGNVDTKIWEVDRYIINSWEVTAKNRYGSAQTYTNWQVKVWLKKKSSEIKSLELLLEEIKKNGPIIKKPNIIKRTKMERELEISILDPHLGLHCFPPAADQYWDIETCVNMVMNMIHDLLKSAEMYGPFKRIILPIGNDFFHADGVFHSTTQGTEQPEMDSWSHVYVEGEKLSIAEVNACAEVAPVKVISVMGNHDRQSIFTLGRLLQAYYHNDKRVEVDASSRPYKFHHFGVNLIGFEHGHSIRQTVRLAALMANECKDIWSQTIYREWHLGDQHRKGSAKPSMMEEQGVSVEFLPGLTPVNEWHALKGFNFQKRAGMAFIWDKERGPIARLQVNVDNYSGKIL